MRDLLLSQNVAVRRLVSYIAPLTLLPETLQDAWRCWMKEISAEVLCARDGKVDDIVTITINKVGLWYQ